MARDPEYLVKMRGDGVRVTSREQRILWHKRRIGKEGWIQKIFEDISTGLTLQDLRHKYAQLVVEREYVESFISLIESPDFKATLACLDDVVHRCKEVISRRSALLMKRHKKSKLRRELYSKELAALKASDHQLKEAVKETERTISRMCLAKGVLPDQFFRFGELEI